MPLTEGVEYLAFASRSECIAACESILASPDLQHTMRAAVYDYYHREVAPEAHLRSCLARAIGSNAKTGRLNV